MNSSSPSLLVICVLSVMFGAIASGEIVYDNSLENGYGALTTEVGDTVTLGGSKRFITSLSLGIYATATDVGNTDHFCLVFYLPNGPDESPGSVIWQSTTVSYEITAEGNQLVTFDVPHVRVPDTFIWSVRHSGEPWFAFADTPSIGSTPTFYWNDLKKQEYMSSSILARIEAFDRPDATLLATKIVSGTGGKDNEDLNNIRFYLYPTSMNSLFGAVFAGITEWEVGTFPSQPASHFPELIEILTNGQNDSISYRVENGGSDEFEDVSFTKEPGISVGYPDLYGCAITDIGLKIDYINIDHDTPDYTYYTYDVTWEIWGSEKKADINKDGCVDVFDFVLLGAAWDTQEGDAGWDPLCNIASPDDNVIDIADLAAFCSKWLEGCVIGFSESFETGDFSAHLWQSVGDAACQVISGDASDGIYSVKTGTISDDQSSGIQLTTDTSDSDISFFIKVSSETDWDFLRFYIDGVETGSWSGELSWFQVTFPVTAGTHTFKWVYEKDNSYTFYQDCAWIDQIEIK